jgi:UDP-galactopyranose mutase
MSGIDVHYYGPHIFHTSNEKVWKYINQFTEFNEYVNRPISVVDGKGVQLPFNMNLFSQLFGEITVEGVKNRIEKEKNEFKHLPDDNIENWALQNVGKTIYEKTIKGYTEKQWGRSCQDLPSEIIKRLPLRFVYDSNYFNDTYQGIPKAGYTRIFEKLLKGIKVLLNTDYREIKEKVKYKKLIYTGAIDEFYDYRFGVLDYRSLSFVHIKYNVDSYQGTAVMNYPSLDVKFTRSVEHKYFYPNNKKDTDGTVVSYEFSQEYDKDFGTEPYYPIGDTKNKMLYNRYKDIKNEDTYFLGRLAEYKYYDMHQVIDKALIFIEQL